MGEESLFKFPSPSCTGIVQKTGLIGFVLLTTGIAVISSNYDVFNDTHLSINDYLNGQFGRVNSEIRKSLKTISSFHNDRYRREFSILLNVSCNTEWESDEKPLNTTVFINFNETFLIIGRTIQVINTSENFFDEDLTKNFAFSPDVTFSKVFEWRYRRFILFGTKSGKTFLYMSSVKGKTEFNLQQIIPRDHSKPSYPVDGEFFIYDENLYLFLVYDSQNNEKVSCRLYQWQNTYFDAEITDVLTERAAGISLLHYGSSIIIVVIQSENGIYQTKKVSSIVLKLSRKSKGKVKLEKIHFLPTKKPKSIIGFESFENNFILVCEEESPSSIYLWNDGEFVRWLFVTQMKDCKSIVPANIADNRIIFVQEDVNGIALYRMTWKYLAKVKVIKFSGDIIAFSVHKSKLITAVKTEETVKVILMDIVIENLLKADSSASSNPYNEIEECFNDLEKAIGNSKEKLYKINHNLIDFLTSHQFMVTQGIIKGSKSNETPFRGNIRDNKSKSDYNSYLFTDFVEKDLNKLLNKSNTLLRDVKQNSKYDGKNYPTFNFKQDLYIEKLKINSVMARLINNYIIDESKMISLSKDQYLNYVEAKYISVNWLLADELATKNFHELVLKTEKKIEWDQDVHTSGLVCCNVIFDDAPLINGINLNNVVHRNNRIYFVSEIKKFSSIKADSIVIDRINGLPFDKWHEDQLRSALGNLNNPVLDLVDNTVIDHLNVKYINGIDVDLFLNNLFVNGINNTINGDIFFPRGFQVKEVNAQTIYDTKQETSVGLPSDRKSAEATDNSQVKRVYDKRKTNPKQKHVNKKKLFVQGSMQVNEIVFDKCHLIVGNTSVPINFLASEYWTRGTNQTIPNGAVFNKNVNVKGDLSLVNEINGMKIKRVVHIDKTKEIDSLLSFDLVKINGNVTLKNKNETSSVYFDAKKLNDLLSKKAFGGDYVSNFSHSLLRENKINEKLKYRNHSVVSNIRTDNEVISLSKEKITIIGDLIVHGSIKTDSINNLYLSDTKNDFADDGRETRKFGYTRVAENRTDFQTSKAAPLEELNILEPVEKVINKVYWTNGIFVKAMDVNKINALPLHEVLPKVVNGSRNSEVNGKKIFKSMLIVENNLKTDSVNDYNIQDALSGRYLSKSKPQNIIGDYHLKNVSIGSVKTTHLNRIDTDLFVNIKSDEEIFIKYDEIIFDKLTVDGDVITHNVLDGCHLPEDDSQVLLDLSKTTTWSVMDVKGDVNWDSDKYNKGKLQTLFDDAVTLDGVQKITGTVIFSNDIITDNIYTNKAIKGVNVSHILSDAVVKRKNGQIITGEKIFVKSVDCLNATVLDDALIETVNGVNITFVYENAVIRKVDRLVTGHKHFEYGFTASNFITKGRINSILTEHIVMADTEEKLPNITFQNLEVIHNFNFETINDIKLLKFLRERVLVKGDKRNIESDMIFNGNITLIGESFIQSLNKIIINDVVLKTDLFSDKAGIISGCKSFTELLTVRGKLTVDLINDKDVSEMYDSCVLFDTSAVINGSVRFGGNVTMNDNTMRSSSFKVDENKLLFLSEDNGTLKNFITDLCNKCRA